MEPSSCAEETRTHRLLRGPLASLVRLQPRRPPRSPHGRRRGQASGFGTNGRRRGPQTAHTGTFRRPRSEQPDAAWRSGATPRATQSRRRPALLLLASCPEAAAAAAGGGDAGWVGREGGEGAHWDGQPGRDATLHAQRTDRAKQTPCARAWRPRRRPRPPSPGRQRQAPDTAARVRPGGERHCCGRA